MAHTFCPADLQQQNNKIPLRTPHPPQDGELFTHDTRPLSHNCYLFSTASTVSYVRYEHNQIRGTGPSDLHQVGHGMNRARQGGAFACPKTTPSATQTADPIDQSGSISGGGGRDDRKHVTLPDCWWFSLPAAAPTTLIVYSIP